jgi:hypothetical protein
MSTLTPFPVLALIGAVSGAVTAWLLLRRDRPAEVLTPSSPPEPMPADVTSQLLADERGARLDALRSLAEEADDDPGLRQDCVDEVLAQFRTDPHAPLWELLREHLRRDSPRFWPGMDLHVVFALLADVDLRGCEVRDGVFRAVGFAGDAHFEDTVFTGEVSFEESCFARHAFFDRARFEAAANFEHTTFTAAAAFPGITTHGRTWFDAARFSARTDFAAAVFGDGVSFGEVGFSGPTTFRDARFAAVALFGQARFGGHADFTGAVAAAFEFAGARVRTDVHVVHTWPDGVTAGEPAPRRPGKWAELR